MLLQGVLHLQPKTGNGTRCGSLGAHQFTRRLLDTLIIRQGVIDLSNSSYATHYDTNVHRGFTSYKNRNLSRSLQELTWLRARQMFNSSERKSTEISHVTRPSNLIESPLIKFRSALNGAPFRCNCSLIVNANFES